MTGARHRSQARETPDGGVTIGGRLTHELAAREGPREARIWQWSIQILLVALVSLTAPVTGEFVVLPVVCALLALIMGPMVLSLPCAARSRRLAVAGMGIAAAGVALAAWTLSTGRAEIPISYVAPALGGIGVGLAYIYLEFAIIRTGIRQP